MTALPARAEVLAAARAEGLRAGRAYRADGTAPEPPGDFTDGPLLLRQAASAWHRGFEDGRGGGVEAARGGRRFDPEAHPRVRRGEHGGEFTRTPGGDTPAGRPRTGPAPAQKLLDDLYDEAGAADAAGLPAVAEQLRFALGALHVRNYRVAYGNAITAGQLAADRGDRDRARRIADLRVQIRQAGEKAGEWRTPATPGPGPAVTPGLPPEPPQPPEPPGPDAVPVPARLGGRTHDEVLSSVASRVFTEKGVSTDAKGQVAEAFALIPEKVRPKVKKNTGRLRIVAGKLDDIGSAEGQITAIGLYQPKGKVLTVSAQAGSVRHTAIHEAMHALDRFSTFAGFGAYSDKDRFKKFQDRILASGRRIAAHYDPKPPPNATEADRAAAIGRHNSAWLKDRGRIEMFAELAMQYAEGIPYDLSPTRRGSSTLGQLPPDIARDLDRWFAAQLGPRAAALASALAAAAGRPDQPAPAGGGDAEPGCIAVEYPDGTTGYELAGDDGHIIIPTIREGDPAATD